jgi:transposase-like protein
VGVVSNPGGAKKRWAPEVKARALEIAADAGPGRASRELGISENTIKSWMTRESRKAHAELARANLVMPVRKGVPWPARRAELLGALAELAEESVGAARLAVSEGRSKAASEFAAVAAKALDKCLLLGGDPTSRSESRNLSLQVDSPGLQAVKAEGAAIVAAREAQLEREPIEGLTVAAEGDV